MILFYTELRFWIFVATLLPFALCLLLYGLRSPWRESWVGKSLMMLYASLVATLGFALVATSGVVPEPLRDLLRVLLLGSVSVAGWVQLANILHFQREARHCRATIEREDSK